MPANWMNKNNFSTNCEHETYGKKASKIYGSLSRRKTILSGRKNNKPSKTEAIQVKNLVWTHEKEAQR